MEVRRFNARQCALSVNDVPIGVDWLRRNRLVCARQRVGVVNGDVVIQIPHATEDGITLDELVGIRINGELTPNTIQEVTVGAGGQGSFF